jgi:hypothetical protein
MEGELVESAGDRVLLEGLWRRLTLRREHNALGQCFSMDTVAVSRAPPTSLE